MQMRKKKLIRPRFKPKKAAEMEKDMEYKSLLETTQNTRDLGGYETCYGRKTKSL